MEQIQLRSRLSLCTILTGVALSRTTVYRKMIAFEFQRYRAQIHETGLKPGPTSARASDFPRFYFEPTKNATKQTELMEKIKIEYPRTSSPHFVSSDLPFHVFMALSARNTSVEPKLRVSGFSTQS